VLRLKAEVKAADGLLFVTPEYNRSMPGVLKNAIDHASRPYGQSAFAGKAAGVIGISVGAIGTALAQQHLRNTLAYLDVATLGQPEAFLHAKEGFFDDDGNIGAASREFVQGWMDKYVAFIRAHAAEASGPRARTGRKLLRCSVHPWERVAGCARRMGRGRSGDRAGRPLAVTSVSSLRAVQADALVCCRPAGIAGRTERTRKHKDVRPSPRSRAKEGPRSRPG
jgi:hypothetical protein